MKSYDMIWYHMLIILCVHSPNGKPGNDTKILMCYQYGAFRLHLPTPPPNIWSQSGQCMLWISVILFGICGRFAIEKLMDHLPWVAITVGVRKHFVVLTQETTPKQCGCVTGTEKTQLLQSRGFRQSEHTTVEINKSKWKVLRLIQRGNTAGLSMDIFKIL